MRVLVRHGHFAFYPRTAEDVGQFARIFGVRLERVGDFYTFPALKDAPRYSLTGKLWQGLPANTTYEGRGPWDVMRENGFVYSVPLGVCVPKVTITQSISLPASQYYYMSSGVLIQPGAFNSATALRVMSYDAELDLRFQKLNVREYSDE